MTVASDAIFRGPIDAGDIAAYQTWERAARAGSAERRQFMPCRLAFELRSTDVPRVADGFRLVPKGDRTEVASMRTGRRADVDADERFVKGMLEAIDGRTPIGELANRFPTGDRARFLSVCAGLAGTAISLAPAMQALENRLPLGRLLRFPQQSPYAVSRAYWENAIAVHERLPILYRSASSLPEFVETLCGLHRVATLGETGRNYYGAAGTLVTTPGELRTENVRTVLSEAFLRTIEKWLAPFGLAHAQPAGVEHLAGGRICIHVSGAGGESIRSALDEPRRDLLKGMEALECGNVAALVDACARFHQRLVAIHPFTNINNSIAMSVVNDLLTRARVGAVPHLLLDFVAVRLTPHDYAEVFAATVVGSQAPERQVSLLQIAMLEHWAAISKRQAP